MMLGQIIEERYLVEEELGEGAMGRVYRARHVKVGRQVAIKVMHAELARVPTIVERFAREARVAARLNHPNLIGVLDVGVTPDKLPCIVLELAPGSSMLDIMTGALPAKRVINLIRQLLLGLDFAHSAGLVHRDLKPDNILVETRADGVEIPRIVDFGIAVCNRGGDEIASRRLTEANTVIGTPFYMSPEQAMAKDLDQRSDLFSLGVIMFELLSGMPPFPGSGVDVAYANAFKDAPSIKERADIDVDPLLQAFVSKLMRRRLADRFQSAREALVMLDLIASDRIAAARALSGSEAAENLVPSAPVTPARVAAAAISLPAGSDAMTTHNGSSDIAFESITRVELRAHRLPSRRRAVQAVALAAAIFSLVVGWAATDRSTHELDQEPRIEASTATATATDAELAVRTTAAETAPAITRFAVAPVVVQRTKSPAARPARAPVQRTVIAAAREEMPAAPVAHATIVDSAQALAARYVAVGKALRGCPDELWAKYRLIRINDALKTETSRREALVALASIERSIQK